MTAWAWEAGSWSGITGERRTARRHASARLRSGEASDASLHMVTVVTDTADLDGRHLPVNGTRTEGHPEGLGIRWSAAGRAA